MRTPLVAGNWKMHGSRASIRALLDALLAGIDGLKRVESAVCVPYPYLGEVAERLAKTRLAWGAQNLSEHAQGAFTGEVSAPMLAEFGCRYVLVGHSERRQRPRQARGIAKRYGFLAVQREYFEQPALQFRGRECVAQPAPAPPCLEHPVRKSEAVNDAPPAQWLDARIGNLQA